MASSGSNVAAEQAVTAVMSYVTAQNSYALLASAQAAVVDGWQQVTMVRGSGLCCQVMLAACAAGLSACLDNPSDLRLPAHLALCGCMVARHAAVSWRA